MTVSLVRGFIWSFASRAFRAVFAALCTVFLARFLGPEEYGVYTLIISLVSLLAVILEFGIPPAAARLLAEQQGSDRSVIRMSAAAQSSTLLFGIGFSLVLLPYMATWLNAPGIETLWWIICILIAAKISERFFDKASEGMRRADLFGRSLIIWSGLAPGLAVIAVLMFAQEGRIALGGYALGAAVASLAIAAAFWKYANLRTTGANHSTKIENNDSNDGGTRTHIRKLATYAAPMILVSASFYIYTQSDILLIQALLGSREVGVYGVPLRLIEVLVIPAIALGNASAAFFPSARMSGAENLRTLYLQVTRVVLMLYLPMGLGLALTANELIPLIFGAEFADSAFVAVVYVPYLISRAAASVYSLALDYLGFAKMRAGLVFTSAILNIGINLLLIPRIGIIGAAVATQITYVPVVITYGYILARMANCGARDVLRVSLPVLRASIVMATFVLVGVLAELHVLILIVLGIVSYILAAVRFGAVNRSDFALLRRRSDSQQSDVFAHVPVGPRGDR